MRRLVFKLIRGGIFALVVLATLVALFFAVENWRGKRAWESYRREAVARGTQLSLEAFIPPPVPDDQNFAMIPLLKPLFSSGERGRDYAGKLREKLTFSPAKGGGALPSLGNRAHMDRINLDAWRALFGGKDVLAALQKFDPELREITQAVRAPYSRFPLDYEKGFAANLDHVGILMSLSRIYALRALAELNAGQTEPAFDDVETIFHLAESVKDEPLIISELVRIAIWQTGAQVVWQGLEDHRWPDAQLSALQSDLSRPDLLAGMLRSFRGERAVCTDMMLQTVAKPNLLPILFGASGMEGEGAGAWKFIPSGWIYQNTIAANHFYDTVLEPSLLPAQHRAFPEIEDRVVQESMTRLFGISVPNPYTIFAVASLKALTHISERTAYSQTSLDEAAIACALERYRLATGRYPEALERLAPVYMLAIPNDVITGGPLHYRAGANGGYVLYSVGSNGRDDGGRTVFEKGTTRIDMAQGDWVWEIAAE